MANVSTCAGRLYVDDHGSGPAIVLWPSLLSDGTLYRYQRDELARDHRVLTIDPPGHGRSEAAGHPFTLEDCARAQLEVLDAFGIDDAVLIGVSWGGMTAMRAALLAPRRVKALGLLDTSADPESPWAKPRFRVLLEIFKRWGPVGPLVPAIRDIMFARETIRSKPDLVDEVLSRLETFDRAGVCEAVEAVVFSRRSILDDLPRITVPALVAVGSEDKATPPFRSERIAKTLPNARLEKIPGAGHLSTLEAPFTVNRLLRELLERVWI
ncbi:MAG TPA: alpha/beta fold hydrolase [Planctomycetota bacterium]|nr:alpha/beta fold hydrolase [Planctomycetota bacterium]